MRAPSESQDPGTITLLLARAQAGDKEAEGHLLPLVYRELRQLARRRMAKERADHTLQPTALVNEAFLRMFRSEATRSLTGREHFFALAATVMRQILVDHARTRLSEKRGGKYKRIEIDGVDLGQKSSSVDVIALDGALSKLESMSPRSSRLVELCFFAGFTIEEASGVLGVSTRTLKRDWAVTRTWLHKEIYGGASAVGANLRAL